MGFSRNITLTFGVVNEAVKLTGAVAKDDSTSLKNLCVGQGTEHAPTPINSVYQCPSCGPITDRSTLKKGRPSGDGFAVVNQEDIAQLRADTSKQYKEEVSLTAHPADQVLNGTTDTGKRYYLEPAGGTGKRYAIIRDLIEAHPQYAFVAQYTVSSRVGMYIARVHDGVIVLEGVEEAQLLPAPHVEAEADKAMYEMLTQLVGGLVSDFDSSTYADTYTEQLRDMIDAADVLEPGATPSATTSKAKTSSDDALMAALEAQLEATKAAKAPAKKRTRKAS